MYMYICIYVYVYMCIYIYIYIIIIIIIIHNTYSHNAITAVVQHAVCTPRSLHRQIT